MTHRQFIEKWNGKKCDKDGQYGGQCMDLANMYVCEVFGYPVAQPSPIAASTAYQSFLNGHPDFVKIEGNDISQFQEGDIIYWDLSLGNGAGHVAIFHKKYGEGFESFDQNYPEKSNCHMQWHTTKSVCGVLRHRSLIKKVTLRNMFYQEGKNERQVIEQVVYYHTPNGYEYDVVWINKDGQKKLRKVTSKPSALTTLLLEAGAVDKLHDWTEYSSGIERGEDFDFAQWITNNPEKATY